MSFGELLQFGPYPVCHHPPLDPGAGMVWLRKSTDDDGQDYTATIRAGRSKRISLEMNPASLPSGGQYPARGRVDVFMCVAVQQRNALNTAGDRAERPDRAARASEALITIPSLSPKPSALTSIETVTARGTVLPIWRTLR